MFGRFRRYPLFGSKGINSKVFGGEADSYPIGKSKTSPNYVIQAEQAAKDMEAMNKVLEEPGIKPYIQVFGDSVLILDSASLEVVQRIMDMGRGTGKGIG